jgi:hypothetical protein
MYNPQDIKYPMGKLTNFKNALKIYLKTHFICCTPASCQQFKTNFILNSFIQAIEVIKIKVKQFLENSNSFLAD